MRGREAQGATLGSAAWQATSERIVLVGFVPGGTGGASVAAGPIGSLQRAELVLSHS